LERLRNIEQRNKEYRSLEPCNSELHYYPEEYDKITGKNREIKSKKRTKDDENISEKIKW